MAWSYFSFEAPQVGAWVPRLPVGVQGVEEGRLPAVMLGYQFHFGRILLVVSVPKEGTRSIPEDGLLCSSSAGSQCGQWDGINFLAGFQRSPCRSPKRRQTKFCSSRHPGCRRSDLPPEIKPGIGQTKRFTAVCSR